MDECVVLRIDGNQAVSVICGPCTGREAYEQMARCSMDDGTVAVLVPSGVLADLVSRLKVVNV